MCKRGIIGLTILLTLIGGIVGYFETFGEDYFHREYGTKDATVLRIATIFLLTFSVFVIGFIVLFLLGTVFFGIFDEGFTWRRIPLFGRASSPTLSRSPFVSGLYSVHCDEQHVWRSNTSIILRFSSQLDYRVEGEGSDESGFFQLQGVYSPRSMWLRIEKRYLNPPEFPYSPIPIHLYWNRREHHFYGEFSYEKDSISATHAIRLKWLKPIESNSILIT